MSILAAFFAALFTFCHATSVREASDSPVQISDTEVAGISQYVPTHQEIAHMSARHGYAKHGCRGCQKMNVVYNVR